MSEISWNEFEKRELEAAEDDEKWKEEISRFWQTNMPVAFVKSDYTYFALNLDNNYGEVVSGCAPLFEETEKVSSSFFEFLEQIMNQKVNLDTTLTKTHSYGLLAACVLVLAILGYCLLSKIMQ